MNVLLTNLRLDVPSGTEVYARDLATELKARGFGVEMYAPEVGPIGEALRAAGINVASSTADLKAIPDIIHAHHFRPAVDAIVRFPGVPVVFFVHDRQSPNDTPPMHSHVMRYVAVDHNCLDRLLIDNRIPAVDTSVIYNWVDTNVFELRETWSEKPRRALVFSNYAAHDNYYLAIREACEAEGVELDGIGFALGKSEMRPQDILQDYDIVFAKAKAAMEAMATGAYVVVCDHRGLAGHVTADTFDHFRRFNFGMKTLIRPVEKDAIVEEIRAYDPSEARLLAGMIREAAPFSRAVDSILDLYGEAVDRFRTKGPGPATNDSRTIHDHFVLKHVEPHMEHGMLRYIEMMGSRDATSRVSP